MRQRAAVLIGVRKTGQLQPLKAVEAGVHLIKSWLEAQPGFATSSGAKRVKLLTDTQGAVTAQDVRAAVREFIELGTVEQLFIYFAGHGVNIRFSEYWLLSGAPDDPNEAVNVRSSVDLARHCGIPHVVFISDACRTAADTIQAQAVEGSIIFTNTGQSAEPGCVDIFYASMVGRPALEVRDAAAAARGFEAIYTTALVDALSGSAHQIVEVDGEPPVGRVRPWPLKRLLQQKVPKLLVDRGVASTVSQKPDAIITSDPEQWLSEVTAVPPPTPRAEPGLLGMRTGVPTPHSRTLGMPGVREAREPESLTSIAEEAIRAAMGGAAHSRSSRSPRDSLLSASNASPGEALFRRMHERVASTPIPARRDIDCGFVVHGTSIALAIAARAHVDFPASSRELLRVSGIQGPAANVLIVFSDGYGALLPAIPGYVGSLTYDAGERELSSVEYERSSSTDLVASKSAELRTLRRAVAAAAALGVFRLTEAADESTMLERLESAGSPDAAMAVYLAYALHDAGRQTAIADIARAQSIALGFQLFDVAMLASGPARERTPMPERVFPAVPLLSQGWGLLAAFNVDFPGGLRSGALQRHVTDSLWTLFDQSGVALLRDALDSGELT